MNKAKLPTHIEIDASAYGIEKDSVILLEQLRTIDKRRLKDKVCHLDSAMPVSYTHLAEISLKTSSPVKRNAASIFRISVSVRVG